MGLEVDPRERLGRAERARTLRGPRDGPSPSPAFHSPSHFFRSGWRSVRIAGSPRLAFVTSFAPVSMRLSTVSPRKTAAHRLHRELADAETGPARRGRRCPPCPAPEQLVRRIEARRSESSPRAPPSAARGASRTSSTRSGAKTPLTPPALAFCAASRLSLVAKALSVVAPRVLVRAHDRDVGVRLERVEEALLAMRRARRALLVAEDDDVSRLALRRQDARHLLAGHLPGGVVVGRDEARVVVPLKVGVEDRRPGSSRPSPPSPGRASALSLSGASTIPLTPWATKLWTRSICDLRSSSLSGPFQTMSTPASCGGLHRAGVDRLPELVRRPLGDDGDARASRRRRAASRARRATVLARDERKRSSRRNVRRLMQTSRRPHQFAVRELIVVHAEEDCVLCVEVAGHRSSRRAG